jgi:hypothetical protein
MENARIFKLSQKIVTNLNVAIIGMLYKIKRIVQPYRL